MNRAASDTAALTPSLAADRATDVAAQLGLLLHWMFRVGMLMEFVGHGAWGVITKAAWVPYFGVFGISERTAYQLMPVIGTMDIALGVVGFLSPRRWALAYGAFWGLFTALLRPAAGESWWEVLDRGGNILGPFTFLLLSGFPRAAREWWEPIQWKPVTREQLRGIARSLKILAASVLIGHGAYGALLQKEQLQDQYVKLGLTGLPMIGPSFISALGWFEIALGVAILFRPLRAFALAACLFKIVTELFYPLTGAREQWWEWVERGFTYLGPLALFFVLPHVKWSLSAAALRALVSAAVLGSAHLAPASASAQDTTAARSPAAATAGADTIPLAADSSLVANLRHGGYIIMFRHAATNWDEKDAAGEDFENRAAQRNLSGQGRADAAAIGKAFDALAVPIDSIFASPMWRCRDTAELAFASYETMVELFRKGPVYRETRIRMLSTKPLEGKNRILVGHQDPLIPIIPGLHRDQLKEGDALVIEPLGDRKYKVVSQVTPADWTRLAGAFPAHREPRKAP